MKGKGLIAAGVGLAALETFNRRVTMPREKLENQLPVEPQMWQWRYGRVAVYVAGDPANPPLLMLHGHNAAASAAEMRQPFKRLSERFHVYAPDLLGYGLSDRPDIDYNPQLCIEFIEDIVREVIQRPAAVLASSLTAAHAIEAAYLNPEWISQLVLVCPTGIRSLTEQSAAGKVLEAFFKLPVLGLGAFYGIASRPSIRYFLESQTYFDATLVTDRMVDRYHRTSHVPGAQHAPAAFVSGKLYWDANETWSRLEQPTLIVWGKEAAFTPPSDGLTFAAVNPSVEMEEIGAAGNLPHDEQPEQFANVVKSWLERQMPL